MWGRGRGNLRLLDRRFELRTTGRSGGTHKVSTSRYELRVTSRELTLFDIEYVAKDKPSFLLLLEEKDEWTPVRPSR